MRTTLAYAGRSLLIGIAFVQLACQSEADLMIPTAPLPDLLKVTVGDARAALGHDGKFINMVHRTLPNGPPEVDLEEVEALAMAWVRHYAEIARVYLEPQHRGEIDGANLQVCYRTFYASSRFEALPDDVLGPERRRLGPWWLVQLCNGSVRKVLLGVSAYNRGILAPDGDLDYPRYRGMHFRSLGIPDGRLEAILVSPEVAVLSAVTIADVPVAQVPELVMSRRGVFRVQWRIELADSASVRRRGSGEDALAAELWVDGSPQSSDNGPGVRVGIRSASDQGALPFSYASNIEDRTPLPRQLIFKRGIARVRNGFALVTERVQASSPSAGDFQ